jgi:succinoglycan biosynthesis transport protein ExoP
MKKSRLHGIKDYLALFVRRKWWAFAAFIIFAGAAALFAKIVPDIYESESMILIKPQEIPSEFVKDLTAGNTDERLSIIQKTILSRDNLLDILDKYEEYLPDFRGLNDQRKVAKLIDKIRIEFPSERVRGRFLPTNSIMIICRDRSPELAKKINEDLTQLFINKDLENREVQVNETTGWLQDKLDEVAAELKESEAELQRLKSRYPYELPSDREINLRALERLQDQKNSNIEALDRSASLKRTLEQQLSAIPPTIPLAQTGIISRNNQMRDPAVEAYRRKEQEYKEAIAGKKETHPEVRRLKAEMEELKKDIPEELLNEDPNGSIAGLEENPEPDTAPNPAYQNLLAQLQQVNTEIEISEREKSQIESDIKLYNQRVKNTPRVEGLFAEAVRENEDLKKEYDSLKGKLVQAELSKSAANDEKGAQFEIINSASYPYDPAPPGRPVIFLAGLAVSLCLSLGAAFLVDICSPKIFTQAELERVLETKVLVEIPRITTLADVRKKRWMGLLYAAAFVALTGAYGGCLYYLYLKQSKLLPILDPLIQRIQG